jgi:hypothetical protein
MIEDGQAFLFSMFAERRMCNAGDCEDWHYMADVCPKCLVTLANRMMGCLDKKLAKDEKEILVEGFGMRVE